MNDLERAHYEPFREALAKRDDLRRVGHAKSERLEMSVFAVPSITLEQLATPGFAFEDAPFVVELRGSSAARFQPALPYDDAWTISRVGKDGTLESVTVEMIGSAHRTSAAGYAFEVPADLMAQSFVHFSSMIAPFTGMVPADERRVGSYVVDVSPLHATAGDERVSVAPLRFNVEIVR